MGKQGLTTHNSVLIVDPGPWLLWSHLGLYDLAKGFTVRLCYGSLVFLFITGSHFIISSFLCGVAYKSLPLSSLSVLFFRCPCLVFVQWLSLIVSSQIYIDIEHTVLNLKPGIFLFVVCFSVCYLKKRRDCTPTSLP